MRWCVVIVLMLARSPLETRLPTSAAAGPSAAVELAAADASRLHPEKRVHTRYLDISPHSPEQRVELATVVSFLLNSFSDRRQIRLPREIDSGHVVLLAFCFQDYVKTDKRRMQWHDAWERLVADDPFFHVKTTLLKGGQQQQVVVDGRWIDQSQATALRTLTNSTGAVLRATYFVAKSARITDGGEYYELAGIPNQQHQYFELFGIDVTKTIKVEARTGANLLISGVTRKPRRILRLQGPLGGSYMTFDSALNIAERDPLRTPIDAEGGFHIDYDAGEFISVAPNGLMKFALFDSDLKRQDTVPDAIAKDDSDPTGDGILQPMISCVRCHRNQGLFAFEDDLEALTKQGVELLGADEDLVNKAAAFYDQQHLQWETQVDRERYRRACKTATGTDGTQMSERLARVYRGFVYLPVTADTAAQELGVSHDRFNELVAPSSDPILLALRLGRSVTREQWHASFAEAAVRTTTEISSIPQKK